MKKIFITLVFLFFAFTNYCFANQDYNSNFPLPGETMANTKLQYDTLKTVFMAVGTVSNSCEDMKVTTTKVTKRPTDLKYEGERAIGGNWEELWSVKACSRTYYVPIKFVLNEKGASYTISPKDIIAR